MSYGTPYIATPITAKAVGRVKLMTKSTSTEAPKASKQYRKSRGEHAKDILIAVLVTAVVAFIGGMHFSNQQHAQTAQAVKAAQATAVAPEVKK
jgi:multidrug resistance efflux pump